MVIRIYNQFHNVNSENELKPVSALGEDQVIKELFDYIYLRRSKIFDEDYYLTTNQKQLRNVNPIWHYVTKGWKDNLNPSPFFDSEYYQKQTGLSGQNPFIHYLKHGGFEGKNPCIDFDSQYVLDNNKDTKDSKMNPLQHYILHGGFEGRNPSENFDSNYYLNNYPDVKKSGMNPLRHYLIYGRSEKRYPKPSSIEEILVDEVMDKTENSNDYVVDYQELYNNIQGLPTTNSTDIVICVGPNPNNFYDCLASIQEHTPKNSYTLHCVIHQSDLAKIEEKLPADARVYTHEMQLFNYSMANNLALKHCSNDIVLLNDDTEVTQGWLDKLKKASKGIALTGAHTGYQCSGNPQMWGEGPITVTYFPINTFCAYIPRKILETLGLFDEQFHYYGGEDVDYSCRALLNGFPLVISDAYVNHKDNNSFKDSKAFLIKESDKIVHELYGLKAPFFMKKLVPNVSIIIATRNRPRLLQKTLESIKSIDYSNYEIIIVDDFSDSETSKTILDEQNQNDRIVFVRLPKNVGANTARAIGMKVAKGQFLLFVDDDDIVLSNRISSQLHYLLYHPDIDVAYSNFLIFEKDGSTTPYYNSSFDLERIINSELSIGFGMLLGRRKAFADVPLHKYYDSAGDVDWVFRASRKGYKFELCSEITMIYNRSGSESFHLSGNNNSIKKHEEIFERETFLINISRNKKRENS